jgi:hypothetical protein
MTDTAPAGQLLTLSQALTTDAGDTRQLLATRGALAAQVAGTTTPDPADGDEQGGSGEGSVESDTVEAAASPLDLSHLADLVSERLATRNAHHALAAFESFGHYALAVYRGDADPDALGLALVDQVTGDNPGVMGQQTWVSEIAGIVARGRPLIEGTGGAMSAGDSGLAVNWPYFDGDLAAIVAQQTAEKSEVNSVKVSIKKGTEDLLTWAAGSDVALQLIERSDPAYLDALLRIYAAAYGVTTETAFETVVAAAAGSDVTYDPAATGSFFSAVVAAWAKVEDATGAPPSVIGVRADSWASVAGAVDDSGRPLYLATNPANAGGTGTPAGFAIAGVPVVRLYSNTPKAAYVLNGAAARWVEDGPRTIDALAVSKLGRDVAIYGYGNGAAFAAKGIVSLTGAAARTTK